MSQQEQRPLRGTEAEIYQRYLVPAVFAPWAAMLIEQAVLQPGERVLDVACGTGVVARLAVKPVGSTGQIIGLDNDAEKLRVARSLPPLPGVSLAWQEGNALAMPFADASFDALLCQQGLQFFPDRPAALREMHRVLVPGGRLVLSVWGSLERCPGHAALVRSLEQFVRLEMIPSYPESPLAGMDERALSVLISEVNTALQPYVSPDGLAFPMQAHLVTAQK
jgi:SAM-dependent methyltransferase